MQEQNNRQQIVILLCFLIFLGGIYLQNLIWPPKPPIRKDDQAEQAKEEPKAAEKKPIAPKVPDNTPRYQVRLGGAEGYDLSVRLDTLGASVRQVVLNKFQEADAKGKPEFEEGKKPKPLEWLIDDKNAQLGSNVLYHFDPDNETEPRPVDLLGTINWKIIEPARFDPGQFYTKVSFQAEVDGVRITKTYSLEQDSYHIGLEVQLENIVKDKPDKVIPFRYQLTGGHGLRMEGDWYTNTFRNALLGRINEKNELFREFQDLRYISVRGGGDEILSSPNEGLYLHYAGNATQYFASMIVVNDKQTDRHFLRSARPTLETGSVKGTILSVTDEEIKLKVNGKEQILYLSEKTPAFEDVKKFKKGDEVGIVYQTDALDRDIAIDVLAADKTNWQFLDDITVRVNTEPTKLKVGVPVVHKYLLYNGPVKVRLLGHLAGDKKLPDELVSRYLDDLRLDTLTDYNFQGQGPAAWIGEHISSSIGLTRVIISVTNLMHAILTGLHKILPGENNYGLCIVLLTVLVRGLMFPISRKMALTSMRMQELAPELKKLQEKFKDDPQARTRAQWELYRKHNVSPIGSCWIVFLQMPIFLGLYYALQESIHFRLAQFLWIDNLAAPDMLIHWGESIPFVSRPESYGGFFYLGPYFNLLPIIAVAFMIVQQKYTMPPPTDDATALNQKVMKFMMIFMGLFFYKVASGLCLYFIASSVWGFTERKLLPKKQKTDSPTQTQQKLGLLEKALARLQAPNSSSNGAGGVEEGSQPINGDSARKDSAVKAANLSRKNKRKGGRNRPESASPDTEEEGAKGLMSGLRSTLREKRRRLSEWWNDILEQARKK